DAGAADRVDVEDLVQVGEVDLPVAVAEVAALGHLVGDRALLERQRARAAVRAELRGDAVHLVAVAGLAGGAPGGVLGDGPPPGPAARGAQPVRRRSTRHQHARSGRRHPGSAASHVPSRAPMWGLSGGRAAHGPPRARWAGGRAGRATGRTALTPAGELLVVECAALRRTDRAH